MALAINAGFSAKFEKYLLFLQYPLKEGAGHFCLN